MICIMNVETTPFNKVCSMDFKKLKYFLAIARAGSFSHAAMEINIAQPALSRQIKDLELELGADLFHRNGRGVKLTPAGEILLNYASSTMEGSLRVQRDIKALGGLRQGSLTLGVLPSLSSALLQPLVVQLHERHPGIRLSVKEAMSGTMLDFLQSGKVDIAIVYDGRFPSSIIAEHLLTDDIFAVRKPRHDGLKFVTGSLLKQMPLVLPCHNHGIRQLVDANMHMHNIDLDIRFEIDSVPTIKDLITATDLVTLLPYGAVAEEVEAGSLEVLPLAEPALQRRLALATTGGALDNVKRTVVKAVQSVVHDLSSSQHWETPRRFAPF